MKRRLAEIWYWANIRSWVQLIIVLASSRDVKGRENVPRKGPLILTSNHLNLADPPILTYTTPRRIRWMAKRELFDIPIAGLFYRAFGCLPVRRFEADLQALRKSQELLRRGEVLGMFPEGTRSRTRGLTTAEPGTALLALRTGAPVLPVAIWGTEGIKLPRNLFKYNRIHVRYGEPFTLPQVKRITRAEVQAGTDAIMKAIAALLPPEYRGVYGDGPEGQPKEPLSVPAKGTE
jgi:1-acyl-sn-glycerol-3-phosphate acyltransferase